MNVIKSGGRTEEFSEKKLRRSITKSIVDSGQKAEKSIVDKIVNEVKKKLHDNMFTSEIREIALLKLERINPEAKKSWMNFDSRFKQINPSLSEEKNKDTETVIIPIDENESLDEDIFPLGGWMNFFKTEPNSNYPQANITESKNKIIADIELPGINKKDIVINLTQDSIEIATKKSEEKKSEKKYYFSNKRFYRRIPLLVKVDEKNAKGTFENGILHIEIPKLKDNSSRRLTLE
jgi:HSP20 family protein